MAVGDPAALHHPDQSSPRATRPDLPGKKKRKKNHRRKNRGQKVTDQHRRQVDRAGEGSSGRGSSAGSGRRDVHVTARAGGGGRGDGGNRAARRDDDPLPPASASSPFPSLSHGLPHGDGGSGATAEQRAAAGGPIDG